MCNPIRLIHCVALLEILCLTYRILPELKYQVLFGHKIRTKGSDRVADDDDTMLT
jgi:hypothetical protein